MYDPPVNGIGQSNWQYDQRTLDLRGTPIILYAGALFQVTLGLLWHYAIGEKCVD